MNLSLNLCNPANPPNLLSVKNPFEWMPERDSKEIRWFFLFFLCSSSLFLKVSSVWHAPPLNYFTFLFPPYLPTNPHCVAGCFLSYDSAASSSLTGSFIPLSPVRHPSFAVSASLLCFLFILWIVGSSHFQRTPWFWSSFTAEPPADKTWDTAALTLKSQGRQNTFLFLWPCVISVAARGGALSVLLLV